MPHCTDTCRAALLFLCCSKISVWFSIKHSNDLFFFRNTLIRLKIKTSRKRPFFTVIGGPKTEESRN